MNINDLDLDNLGLTLKRLRKSTKDFSTLLVRDTFDNVDFLINESNYLNQLIFGIKSGKYSPFTPCILESPKSKGISRPTTVLSIEDSIVYRFCIESIQDELFAGVDRNLARGGMKITAVTSPEGDTYYEKWFDDWMDHNKSIEKGLKYKSFLVSTDVASYFENINVLLLKDLVRSKVKEKNDLLNLLFYFIESTKLRHAYEVNTFNGLLQEDIDCSRILAYFFLSPHDKIMKKFCSDEGAEFYRFVDDMSILVDSEVQARKALKVLTKSLREIGLISSIEKTSILTRTEAEDELFFEENNYISVKEKQILELMSLNLDYGELINDLVIYYRNLDQTKNKCKNWQKILKRFYTVFSYTGTDIILPEIINHLISFPSLFVGKSKLVKYLLSNKKSDRFNETIEEIVEYLHSGENLYPALETSLLEMFLYLDPKDLALDTRNKIGNLGESIFFCKNYSPQSDYARALACLIVYAFKKEDIQKLALHYCKSREEDELLKKYLFAVSLTTQNNDLRGKLIEKARKEQGVSFSRLVNMIDSFNEHKNTKVIKNYLKSTKLYIYYSKENDLNSIKIDTVDVRKLLLGELREIYCS
jgi:hypothetical protein